MGKDYNKNADKYICSLTLGDLESKNTKFEFMSQNTLYSYDVLSAKDFLDIVLFASSEQSNIGIKLTKEIEKHIDEIVDNIMKCLDLKSAYFYKRYDSESKKEDIKSKIMNNNRPYICMYVGDAFTRNIYESVRNALAHGNIAKRGKYYYLFSFTKKDIRKPLEERRLNFIIKAYKLNNLSVFMDTLIQYNQR